MAAVLSNNWFWFCMLQFPLAQSILAALCAALVRTHQT